MTDKYEHWRNQTLVNRTKTDIDIAREYYTLTMYILDNYQQRMETIQNPLLHLISHCLELIFKECIEKAISFNYIEGDMKKIIHMHDLEKLSSYILSIVDKISNEVCCSETDKELFTEEIAPAIQEIVKCLKTNTTTYRYAKQRNSKGEIIKNGHPFIHDAESANIEDLKILFSKCYGEIGYIEYILDFLFPETE